MYLFMILDFYNKLVLDVLYSFNSFLLIVSYKLPTFAKWSTTVTERLCSQNSCNKLSMFIPEPQPFKRCMNY